MVISLIWNTVLLMCTMFGVFVIANMIKTGLVTRGSKKVLESFAVIVILGTMVYSCLDTGLTGLQEVYDVWQESRNGIC